MSTDALLDYERQLTGKLEAALRTAGAAWDLPDSPLPDWTTPTSDPLPDVPQWPRPRWVTYPARRARALALADRLIDLGELANAGFLVTYGGRERT